VRPSRRLALTCAWLAAATPARAAADDDVYPPDPPAASAPLAPAPLAPAPPPEHDHDAAPEPAEPGRTPSAPASPAAEGARKARIRYTLEGIELRGNARTAPRAVLRYVRFRAGDVLDVDDPEIELTRYRLLGTGFFASVQLSLRKGTRRGSAVLVIEVVERNTLIVRNLWLGVAADEDTSGDAKPISPFVGLDVAERNLVGAGITLGAGLGLAADQLALRLGFADPAFAGSSYSVSAGLLYSDARDFFGSRAVSFESPLLDQREVVDYAVVAYKRFGGSIGAGLDLSTATRLSLDYGLERIDATVPTVASHLRGDTREPIRFDLFGGKSVLSALRATLVYDTRDSPSLPARGTLASASLSGGLPPLGSDYGYQKLELSAQRWWRLPWKHVVRLDAYAGAITGDAPFFQKFYVGDFTDLLPDRLLELAPDRRKPPNLLRTDIVEVRYGDYAARLGGEYRVPLYVGRESIYGVDLFASAGVYGVATRRELTEPPRSYTGFARVPVDLTYNLGLRVDTSVGVATIAFSNLLGLLPAGGGDRK
jgi:outer membrane protein assembly factor BamA